MELLFVIVLKVRHEMLIWKYKAQFALAQAATARRKELKTIANVLEKEAAYAMMRFYFAVKGEQNA